MHVAVGDFNVTLKQWYCYGKSTLEGKRIGNITQKLGLYQMVKKPRSISNASSFGIELIYKSQPHWITGSRKI